MNNRMKALSADVLREIVHVVAPEGKLIGEFDFLRVENY